MATEQLDIQLKLLIDILNKKFSMLNEILSITENQGILLKSCPDNREMFLSMFDEKQIRIDNISSGDDIFNRIFKVIVEDIKRENTSYKVYVSDMQVLVKAIMDLEIRIRLEERNNTKYMKKVINTVPMKVVAKHYNHQKTQKISDAIKPKKRY